MHRVHSEAFGDDGGVRLDEHIDPSLLWPSAACYHEGWCWAHHYMRAKQRVDMLANQQLAMECRGLIKGGGFSLHGFALWTLMLGAHAQEPRVWGQLIWLRRVGLDTCSVELFCARLKGHSIVFWAVPQGVDSPLVFSTLHCV